MTCTALTLSALPHKFLHFNAYGLNKYSFEFLLGFSIDVTHGAIFGGLFQPQPRASKQLMKGIHSEEGAPHPVRFTHGALAHTLFTSHLNHIHPPIIAKQQLAPNTQMMHTILQCLQVEFWQYGTQREYQK